MYNDRIMQLLARKVAGEATDDELTELKVLLERYPDNLYYEEVLNQLWEQSIINDEDIDEAYLRHREKFKADFVVAEPPSNPAKLFTLKRLMIAASLIVISAIGLFYYKTIKSLSTGESLYTEIIAQKGIRKKVVLPDGTQVWLNSNSKISFDNNMGKKPSRLVNLTGEAYFDVTKDKHHPFIIHTDKFSIKVLGTAFNIKAYPGDKKAEAALIRGMIELTINDSLQEKFILRPNEKFAVAYSNPSIKTNTATNIVSRRKLILEDINPVEIANKEYIEETSWVDNKLVFKNETLEELIPKLERWYNIEITIQNEKVKKYHFTGVLQNETITQALTAMQIIRPFTFKIDKYDVKID